MPKYGDSKLATAENLEEFAKAIETFAAEFRRLATKLREYGLGEIDVGLLPTGADGMERLSRFAANAMKCYLDAAAGRGLAFAAEPAPPLPPNPQDLSRPLSPSEQAATEDTAAVVNVASGMKLGGESREESEGEEVKYTRKYVGGPADGGTDNDLEPGYPSLTMKIFASDNPKPGDTLDLRGHWGLYEIDRVETGEGVTERVYRYVRSGPYEELQAYMMKESRRL